MDFKSNDRSSMKSFVKMAGISNSMEKSLINTIDIEKQHEKDLDSETKNIFIEKNTFGYLLDLHEIPTMDSVNELWQKLEECVIYPTVSVLKEASAYLPNEILINMETENNLHQAKPFHRNQWGFGNRAWDFFWCAIYPKACERNSSGYLFIWINHERIEFGFAIGQIGTTAREKFKDNFLRNRIQLYQFLQNSETGLYVYSSPIDTPFGPVSQSINSQYMSWSEWLKRSENTDVYVSKRLSMEKVVEMDQDDLIDNIVESFTILYPLIILSKENDPMPLIGEYVFPTAKTDSIKSNYSFDDLKEDTFVSEKSLQKYVEIIKRKKQAIFYGPPGTGKTFLAKKIARYLADRNGGFYDLVQFHPSYSYEDFVEGIRPINRSDGKLEFVLKDGFFKRFCQKAKHKQGEAILIIDEINRAKLSLVFGELLYLMEYREEKLNLSTGGELLLPNNLIIIGTMNSADRSLEVLDHAMRRRFAFIFLDANMEIIRNFYQNTEFDPENLIRIIENINHQINDQNYSLGISFFLDKRIQNNIERIWLTEIEPYLEELFFDQSDMLDQFRWDNISEELVKN